MANWAFEIDVADNFIVGLTETLVDKGFRIWCIQQYEQPLYLFSSAYLSTSSDAQVYGQARKLGRFIDGLSYLLFENKEKVNKINFTTVMDADSFSVMNVARSNHSSVSLPIDFSVYRPLVVEDEAPISHLLKLVPSDIFVQNLLLVLSQGMDFKSIDQAYGLIMMKLEKKGGTLAGFGLPDGKVLESMPLQEAQEVMTEVVFEVLERYYKINLKHYIVKDREAGAGDWYDSLYD